MNSAARVVVPPAASMSIQGLLVSSARSQSPVILSRPSSSSASISHGSWRLVRSTTERLRIPGLGIGRNFADGLAISGGGSGANRLSLVPRFRRRGLSSAETATLTDGFFNELPAKDGEEKAWAPLAAAAEWGTGAPLQVLSADESSSRLRSQNKPFTNYSERSEKLRLGAAVENEVGGIQPMGDSAEKGVVRFTRRFFHVLETLATRVLRVGDGVREAVQKPNTQEELQLLAALKGRMVCAAAPLLVAAISQSVNTPLTVVASGMAKWLELYSGVLMVRVLLSWFPNIPWERQPLQAMRDMCDPYLNLFRNIIPPLFNALDLSPMLAFLVLGVLTSILNTTVQAS